MSSKDIKEGDLGSAQIVYMAVKSWTEICRLLVKTAWTVFMFTLHELWQERLLVELRSAWYYFVHLSM